jgi:hypothetical protein
MDDEGYFNALVRMFEQTLKTIKNSESGKQADLVKRIEHVRQAAHNWGGKIGDDMDNLMVDYGFTED